MKKVEIAIPNCHWLKNVGHVTFEFALKLTFGVKTVYKGSRTEAQFWVCGELQFTNQSLKTSVDSCSLYRCKAHSLGMELFLRYREIIQKSVQHRQLATSDESGGSFQSRSPILSPLTKILDLGCGLDKDRHRGLVNLDLKPPEQNV